MTSARALTAWAALVTVAATAFLVSPEAARSPMRSLGLLAPKPAALAIGALLCAAACARSWRGSRLSLGGFELAAFCYVMLGGLSALVNQAPLPFVLPWLALAGGALLVLAAASQAAEDGFAPLVIDGLLCVAALVAAVAIYEAAGGALPWDAPRRPGATFANRNAVGGFCAIVAPLALVRCLTRPAGWRALALAALLLVVLLCRARSSWMGLLVAAALAGALLMLSRRGAAAAMPSATSEATSEATNAATDASADSLATRRGLGYVLAAVALAVTALLAAPWRLSWSEDSPIASSFSRLLEYDAGTGRSRVEQHLVGLEMLAARPLLGFGPGTWRREAPRYAHAAPDKHASFIDALWTPASDPLRQAVECGALGLAAGAAMAALLLAGALRRWRATRDLLLLALASSLGVALVISCFDASLARPPSLALVAVLAGLLHRAGRGGGGRAVLVSARPVLAVALAAAGLAVAIQLPRYLAARRLVAELSPRVVVANGALHFLPYESLLAVTRGVRTASCRDYEPAAALVARMLPQEPRLLIAQARCAEQAGQRERAVDLLTRALQIEPHDDAGRRELARLRAR